MVIAPGFPSVKCARVYIADNGKHVCDGAGSLCQKCSTPTTSSLMGPS